MHHLGKAVEQFDLARHNATLACWQQFGQIITARVEKYQLKRNLWVDDINPICTAFVAWGAMLTNFNFNRERCGQIGPFHSFL